MTNGICNDHFTPACTCTPIAQPRQSRVINRAYVRSWALDYAKDKRLGRFTRVSEEFLNAVEASTKSFIRDRIDRHPSRGKTLT